MPWTRRRVSGRISRSSMGNISAQSSVYVFSVSTPALRKDDMQKRRWKVKRAKEGLLHHLDRSPLCAHSTRPSRYHAAYCLLSRGHAMYLSIRSGI